MRNMVDYTGYQHLLVEKMDGIAFLTLNRPEVLNATNFRLHYELSRVWLDLGEDPEVRVVLITGSGRGFSAGADLEMIEDTLGNPEAVSNIFKEANDLIYNMINLDKPVVSAINGVAMGAGLAVALLADISIASENARFTEAHIRMGVAAGDHACLIWPLLCGMAKAKYYLLTCDSLDGREAERIGLVSMVVPHEELIPKATEVARKLASGPQHATRWTKRALNQWLRMTSHTSFEYSLAVEMLGFYEADAKEGLRALQERRTPDFPSAR